VNKLSFSKMACIVFVFCTVTVMASPAQTTNILIGFDGTNGASPNNVVQGFDGNLYGTTGSLGANGGGTVFKITAGGKLTTLYSFCAQTNCADGAIPDVGLVQGTDGNFYGTTFYGGTGDNCTNGCGTVFKISPGGVLKTLHNFDLTDGSHPAAGLMQGTDGRFYGSTSQGGANNSCTGGCGTVFKITAGGKLTTLHSFDSTDGAGPFAGLVQGTDGNFYGTTSNGGANCFPFGCGTVFKITTGGALATLYSFCTQTNCADGAGPSAGLVQATDGNFYGTTGSLGANGGGTVFKITAGGTLATLYSFCTQTNCADGSHPTAGLVQATDGSFYGTTSVGGSGNNCFIQVGCGTVFKITTGGKLTTLHSFCSQTNCADGRNPLAGLVQATNGKLYGATSLGRANNRCADGCGTLFSLSVGLGSFVETQPTSGKVGAAVTILGTNLTGATSVSFNGKTAAFKVVSSSEITTMVPTGATTGKVKVKTPHGTFVSNVVFRVTT
jgi:uncharacterized repeat protein (TIGR03803 family)